MSDIAESFEYKGYSVEICYDADPMDILDSTDFIKVFAPHRNYKLGNTDEDAPKGTKVSSPVYMYEHGGRSVSLGAYSCPWDSGRLGTIYITNEDLKKEFKGRVKDGRKCLEAWFEEYQAWVAGEIYGYVIKKITSEGLMDSDDSCWGYYGMKDCTEQAKAAVDWLVESDRKARENANNEASRLAGEYVEIARHV